jgi:hypothetical protein
MTKHPAPGHCSRDRPACARPTYAAWSISHAVPPPPADECQTDMILGEAGLQPRAGAIGGAEACAVGLGSGKYMGVVSCRRGG